jgi:hypothetical protein
MPLFPHINDTAFPGVANIDVYKYRNELDYTRWHADTVIKVMQTRLDADYENVGGWESVADRDAYFDGLAGESVTLTSALHLLPDGTIKLPLPPSVMATYNYLMVTLPIATSAAMPVAYENAASRVGRFFFFVTDIVQRAENATQCILQLDEWTTYAPRAEFPFIMLERGHAPLAATDADTFLQSPITNNAGLLAPDVNFGSISVARASSDVILNAGESWACFATAANPRGNWGSYADNTLNTPAITGLETQQGLPSVSVFAIEPTALGAFLEAVEEAAPQFKRAVLAIFLMPKVLATVESTFQFCGHECRQLAAVQTSLDLIELTKDSFGYAPEYADLAKLYTAPYAHIEITDGNSTTTINIEDTTGTLSLEASAQIAWPFLGIDAYISGVGGTASRNVTFRNLTDRTVSLGGTWYETLRRWEVPTFAIVQSAGDASQYGTFYDRAQSKLAADTAYGNVTNSTGAQTANTALSVAAASAIAGIGNEAGTRITNAGNSLSQALQAWDAGMTFGSTEITNEALAMTTAANAVGNAAGSIASGAMSGGLVGAAGGLLSSAISGVTAGVTTGISISKSSALAQLTVDNSQAKVGETTNNNSNVQGIQNGAQIDITDKNNTLATNTTANSVRAANTNASNNKTVALTAIDNRMRQAALDVPALSGNWAGGATAATRPLGVFCNIVTQPDYAIKAAGDMFLRYGYALNQAVAPTTLNVMRHFSYWKASDVWIAGEGITANARATLRAILNAGTTVWRNIDEIGEVGIYGN